MTPENQSKPLLEIKDLTVQVDGKTLLDGLSLTVNAGETHAIMGPNGSGKSTLANALAGHPDYKITGGSIRFCGKDLLEMAPEERAHLGMFLAFQYPVEIPGVNNAYFLREAVNAVRKAKGEPELDAVDFLDILNEKTEAVGLKEKLLKRSVNEGFSGGEKKRNEILQMALMEPKLGILDETDSGLDIDALKTVAQGVNNLRRNDNGFLVITHYHRLLEHIVPDQVHVLSEGKITRSGGPELALKLEDEGYAWAAA